MKYVQKCRSAFLSNVNKRTITSVARCLLIIIASVFVLYLSINLFAGAVGISFGTENTPSAEASFGIALLATALGAAILWLVSRDASDIYIAKGLKSLIVCVGLLLFLAAFCFAYFGLLSPLLPEVLAKEDPNIWYKIVKYSSFVSLFFGGLLMGIGICVGFPSLGVSFVIFCFKLRKNSNEQ